MPWKALGEKLPKDNFFSVQAHCRKTRATSKERATAILKTPSARLQEAQTSDDNGLWTFWNTHA